MNKIEKISLNYKNYHVQGYKLGNDKTPVLLLHGGGVDNAMLSWREVMAILSENFTVYAYDHIGYGESDIASETMSVPFNVAVLEAVVEQLGLDKFILSGISMGGTISIGYTLAHSKKVMALILISPWGLNARPKYFNLLKLVAKYWNTPKIYKFTAKYPFLLKLSLN